MQQILSTILALISSIFGVSNLQNVNLTTPIPSSLVTNKYEVEFNQNKYSIYLQKITEPKNLSLIPNFSEKLDSSEIMKNNNCKYGINGGFYTHENKPLGLFFSNNQFIQDTVHQNVLFNGYFSKTYENKLNINTKIPAFEKSDTDNQYQFAFQSGPYFTPQTKLNINNDESARRMLVGESDKEEFYFLAITTLENTHSGPLLADLPQIIFLLNSQLNAKPALPAGRRYTLNALLNLDGGSASAFYSDTGIQLSELTPIGSFLCGK
jgi:uncharacterized protein YigE (DUF2233 family)